MLYQHPLNRKSYTHTISNLPQNYINNFIHANILHIFSFFFAYFMILHYLCTQNRSLMLYIKPFYFNPFRECTYVLTAAEPSDQPQPCLIIDPGMYGAKEESRLLSFLGDHKLTPAAILITHEHLDHVCGLDVVLQAYPNTPKYGYNYEHADENTPITLAGLTFRMIYTPGHKEDAVCFYFEQDHILFSGDTLFQESIGRTDLPGGDMPTLQASLQRLTLLPDTTVVYPGHGYTTTIGHEKQNNPFL